VGLSRLEFYMIKNLCALGGFLLIALSGCFSGTKPELLPLPSFALKERLPDSATTDFTNIIENYAKINVGDLVPDGSAVNAPTDAARLEQELKAEHAKIFIRLPENLNDIDHIYKTIRAANFRLNQYQSPQNALEFVDLGELNKMARLFQFNQDQTKELFISLAKKIDNRATTNSILVMDIDSLNKNVPSREFLEKLTKPKLIILSKNNYDALQLFEQGVASTQFVPTGLKLAHMYELLADAIKKAPNPTVANAAQQLALEDAKIMGAFKPNASISYVATFLKLAERLLDGTTRSDDYSKALASIMANMFDISYDYVGTWHLDRMTLAAIQQKVDFDVNAFSASSAAFASTQATLDQIRQNDLPPIRIQTDKIESLRVTATAIKTKTDGLPDDTAAELNAIKTKTDNLPVDTTADLAAIKADTAAIAGLSIPATLGQDIKDIKTQTDTLPAIRTQTDKIKDINIPANLSQDLAALKKLATDIAALDIDSTSLKAKLDTAKKMVAEAGALDIDSTSLKAKLDAAKKLVTDAGALDIDIPALQAKLDAAKKLVTDAGTLDINSAALQAKLDAAKRMVADAGALDINSAALQAKLDAAKRMVADAGALDINSAALQAKLDAAKQMVADAGALDINSAALQAKLDAAKQMVADAGALDINNAGLQSKLDAAKQMVADAGAIDIDLPSLRAKLADAQKAVDAFTALKIPELDKLKNEINELLIKLGTDKGALDSLKAMVDKINRSLTDDTAPLPPRLQVLFDQLNDRTNKIRDLIEGTSKLDRESLVWKIEELQEHTAALDAINTQTAESISKINTAIMLGFGVKTNIEKTIEAEGAVMNLLAEMLNERVGLKLSFANANALRDELDKQAKALGVTITVPRKI